MQQYASRSDEMASRYQAARTRLRKFEEAGPPPEPPRKQDIRMRLHGGRTGMRAITCVGFELTGLTRPFDLEVFYGVSGSRCRIKVEISFHATRPSASDGGHGPPASLARSIITCRAGGPDTYRTRDAT